MTYNTALEAAVWGEDEAMVRLLLQEGANPNDSKEGQRTALDVAVWIGNEWIVKHLLEANADVNLHFEGNFNGVRDP